MALFSIWQKSSDQIFIYVNEQITYTSGHAISNQFGLGAFPDKDMFLESPSFSFHANIK